MALKTAINPAGVCLPEHDALFYGGRWHHPVGGNYVDAKNPATGETIARAAVASKEDVDRAVAAAKEGVLVWRKTPSIERARIMKKIAAIIRDNASQLALLDATNGGNPIAEMDKDIQAAATYWDFYAGLISEIKGSSIPFHDGSVNFSVREPVGIVARIVAYNHPFMFTAGKVAAPLAAGNAVIVKPPEQAPLSGLRLAELIGDELPAGVLGVVTGGLEAGATLTSHPDIAMVTLIGSVPTGRAIMKSAADTLKPVILELGGKNPLIAFADADPSAVAKAAVDGMNFTWCGQSCGSTSRVFLHEDIHDAVVAKILEHIKHYVPGVPTNPATTMGCIISKTQYDKINHYIATGVKEGAVLVAGGHSPIDPNLRQGFFIEPTIFTGVTQDMTIAKEEIFGPVLSILKWSDEKQVITEANSVPYGLTCSIWTNDLRRAHRTASEIQAGFVWINRVGTHFLGAPFGGFKQSGIGKENCLAELLNFTREKNIHIEFAD